MRCQFSGELRVVIRAMCGAKLMDKKNTDELMNILGLKEIVEKPVKAIWV